MRVDILHRGPLGWQQDLGVCKFHASQGFSAVALYDVKRVRFRMQITANGERRTLLLHAQVLVKDGVIFDRIAGLSTRRADLIPQFRAKEALPEFCLGELSPMITRGYQLCLLHSK